MDTKKIVLVVGAGPAGLTAAYELLKNAGDRFRVILIEENRQVGGLSKTLFYKGNRIDLGGHRFFSKSPAVNALWEDLLPMQGSPSWDDLQLGRTIPLSPNGPDPEKTDTVMLYRNRVSRIYFLRKFFDYPISIKWQTFANMGLARTIQSGFGYLASCFHKRPVRSLEDFYINRFGKPLYGMFFEGYTEKLWGVHPSRIAPDWGAQRVKELSLMGALLNAITKPFRKKDARVETSLIESFSYPKHGPGQLWETMADRIREMGGTVLTETRFLSAIRDGDGPITGVVVEETARGKQTTLSCDYLFSSMPVSDLFAGTPGLPENAKKAALALPYRDFMTVGLLVKRLEIKNTTTRKTIGNIVPDCWIYIQENDVKIGRLQIFNNWSPYMVRDPENTVWLGLEFFCREGDAMWTMPDRDFIQMAIRELVKLGIIREDAVLDSICAREKKAYPAYFGTYDQMDEIRSALDAIPNLYCIGRNGQHRYNNMDHSMLTGMEAARLVMEGSNDRSNLWQINAEESYHEEGSST
ncbi:MAG: NAD(P)/FAD-dependent oxidoreductase [Clostridia bacterium]|nr:NAD(P)/FAD-dependent oxidoreductase [Clostridia bacterium]